MAAAMVTGGAGGRLGLELGAIAMCVLLPRRLKPRCFPPSENCRLAAELYKDMPETSFTRTISNPEVVMQRRRQQKLERRMQEFRSSDGRPDSGAAAAAPCAQSGRPRLPLG